MDIKKVGVQLQRPRGNFEGRVESGWYTVDDGTVTLVEPNGVPVDRFKLTRKLKPNEDPHLVACLLLRQRYSKGGSDDFNRKLIYPKVVF